MSIHRIKYAYGKGKFIWFPYVLKLIVQLSFQQKLMKRTGSVYQMNTDTKSTVTKEKN